jgi:hypothetical protein
MIAGGTILLQVRKRYPDDMPDNSPDPTAPEPQRSTGPSTSSTVMIVVIAGACFLMLGACVLCGGGLAIPLLLRTQQQQRAMEDAERAAVEAQRSAVEAQRSAEEQLRSAEETLRNGQETMRKFEEQGTRQDRDAPPDDGDHSRGRTQPE